MFIFGILSKKAKGSREFSIAKHSLKTSSVVAGIVMTLFGAGFIMGGAELGYRYGFIGIIYGIAQALGILALGAFAKKIYKETSKKNIKTIPSLLNYKYKDRKIALISAVLSIIALTAIASAQLFAAMRVFSALEIPVKISLFLITLIVALVATKGIKTLTVSGKFNLIVASIGAIAAIFIAFSSTGVNIQTTQFEVMSLSTLAWILIPSVLYIIIGQDLHQKIYSASSGRIALKACVYSFIFLALLSLFPAIVGMQSKTLFSADPSEAMPRFILLAIPSIFKGLFIAAILAAIVGSSQSVINAVATQISEDIIKPFGKFSDIQLGKIASISAVVVAVIALIITLNSTSIINNIIVAYTMYTSGMFIPTLAAFYLKKPKDYSTIMLFIAIIGTLIAVLIEFNIIKTNMPSIIPAIGTSILVLLLLTIYTRNRKI
ncbi:MAG: hypothetical protein ABIE22_01585 [archaeon]